MSIHYTIQPTSPAAHIFTVTLEISDPDPTGQVLRLPAWIPGSYLVREFSKNIVQIEARDSGENLVGLDKLDKHTWKAAPVQGALKLTYQVYAWDLSVRMAHLDQNHGYFNGTSVFLEVIGQAEGLHTVDIQAPSDPHCKDWRIATTLKELEAERYGFGSYQAESHDELIDHPVEMGTFELLHFQAAGVPHEVAVTGPHNGDLQRLVNDLIPICTHQIEMFGKPAPMDRYLFQLMLIGNGYGGLEHRASTSLIAKRADLPMLGEHKVSDGYRQLLGLCSHEYFHTWNVKRIKPARFVPYDLSTENYTTLLWAFEGITSYYDDLILNRTERIETDSYLELLGRTITRVRGGSGRLKQSLAESSFDAWTKFYRQDENAPNAIVSYYAKGSLAALALDLTIRLETEGAKSLDDVMRALWTEYGAKGIGVPEMGIEDVAQRITGVDLSHFFEHAVRGTEDLPLRALLAAFGVELRFRPGKNGTDRGGKAAEEEDALRNKGRIGAKITGDKIKQVLDEGPAQDVGLSAGDVIVAINGIKAVKAEAMLAGYPPGTTVTIHAFRRDELFERQVTLAAPSEHYAYLKIMEEVEPEVLARRVSWLKGL